MFSEVIVVEGKNDESKIKEIFPNAETISTNGSEISNDIIELIKQVNDIRGVILFFDPDYPGQRIRAKIMEKVPNCKHAFIKRADGVSKNKKKIGVEHASRDVIIEALSKVVTPCKTLGTLQPVDLFQLGLNNRKLRDMVSQYYNLGHNNFKTLLKRLNMIGIKLEELERVVKSEDWKHKQDKRNH